MQEEGLLLLEASVQAIEEKEEVMGKHNSIDKDFVTMRESTVDSCMHIVMNTKEDDIRVISEAIELLGKSGNKWSHAVAVFALRGVMDTVRDAEAKHKAQVEN